MCLSVSKQSAAEVSAHPRPAPDTTSPSTRKNRRILSWNSAGVDEGAEESEAKPDYFLGLFEKLVEKMYDKRVYD